MAANLQSSRRGITNLGKRFVNQIWSAPKLSSSAPIRTIGGCSSRGAHYSVYDKNVDDQVRPTVVPDELIQSDSDKYWGPNPRTGVFGPATTGGGGGGEEDSSFSSTGAAGNGSSSESVLEQKAWFRPLEDVEKPRQY